MRALTIFGSVITAGVLLTGCGGNAGSQSVETQTPSYKVTFTNLTYAQPMAPMAVASHSVDTAIYVVGETAGDGLERLAESGDNSLLLTELSNNASVTSSIGGNGLVLPGQNDSVTLSSASECISVVAMLVNTNDAFAGVNCVNVSSLSVGGTLTVNLATYDAGTESNSETNTTIPGPAAGGEGFNVARDDRNFVTVHAGAITKDDGLMTSVLTQMHKWDNPSASVSIERL